VTKHIVVQQASICEAPFFVASVDEATHKAHVGIDCIVCMRQALAASEARARAIRTLITKAEVTQGPEAKQPEVNQLCLMPHYVAIVDATKPVEVYQAGAADCLECLRQMADKHAALASTFRERIGEPPAPPDRALCHECSEVVTVVDGKFDPHHGVSGDGCPQNGELATIYLHPKVADRIAELETALVFPPAESPR
jgi:hypothetical protein